MKNKIRLLPFWFKNFDDDVLLVNQCGDFLFISREDFGILLRDEISKNRDLYFKLKGRLILADEEDLNLQTDFIANQLRTRKSFLKDFTSLHMIVVTCRCNFRCEYCHASSAAPTARKQDMTWKVAKKVVEKIFDSKNVIVSINGNVNSNEINEQLGKIFRDKKNPKFDYSTQTVSKLNSPKTFSKNIKDLQTAWLFMGWQAAGVQDKKDFVTLKVINTLLGSGLSSRLYRNLRESDGLAYQLGSSYSPKMLGGIFMGYIGTNPSTLEYSRTKMLQEMDKTVEKEQDGLFGNDNKYEEAFKSIMFQQMGRDLANNPRTSFGFADQIYRQMEKFVG